MYKLSPGGMKLLKTLHLITASCWLGGALSLFFLYFLKDRQSSQTVIHGINLSIHHLDLLVIIIPGATGCFLTGLAYSLLTGWGFFKFRWVAMKWILTVSAILFGTFFLGPWEKLLMDLSGDASVNIFSNVTYQETQLLHFGFGTLQVAVLLLTVYLSVYKPWGKRAG